MNNNYALQKKWFPGPDTRIFIYPTESQPYRYICQLHISFPDGTIEAKTGFIYSNKIHPTKILLITSADNLIKSNYETLFQSLKAYLAPDTIKQQFPLELSSSNQDFFIPTSLMRNKNGFYDNYATFLLNRNDLPSKNGSPWKGDFWLNVSKYRSPNRKSWTVEITGFPNGESTPPPDWSKNSLWSCGGSALGVSYIMHNIPISSGQEGSPIWTCSENLPTTWEIIGVQTGLNSFGDGMVGIPITSKVSNDFEMLLSGSNDNNIRNPTFNDSNYLKSPYIDLAEVTCPTGKIVAGISFYLKGNRIAPQLWCTDPNGTNGSWVQNSEFNDHNYLVQDNVPYVDTTSITSPGANYVVRGFSFIANVNRVAPNVGFALSNNINNITWVNNSGKNTPNYFKSPYQDEAPVYVRYTNFEIINIDFYQKGNRMAPQVTAKIIN